MTTATASLPHGRRRAPTGWDCLSIVRLERVQQGCLHFTGNDMLDGTPVLDIKPYVPALDVRHTERIGWFQHGLQRLPTAQSDDRMR